MITGFNTDIEYAGTVYHVQTEDKGLNNPLILSLVYIGGTIIASKRTSYADLVADGFDENRLCERLQRQHKLICAAINAGRIEDLKRLGQRAASDTSAVATAPPVSDAEIQEARNIEADSIASEVTKTDVESLIPTAPLKPSLEPKPARASQSLASLLDGFKSLDRKPPPYVPPAQDAVDRKEPKSVTVESQQDGLILMLHYESELRAGAEVTLRLAVSRGDKELRIPMPNASIVIKILGTTFRPVIHKAETGKDGTAIVQINIPPFTAGRAALLIESCVDGDEVALRRIIRQA